MKKFKNLSVNVKVPVMMGIAGLVIFALVCVLLMRPLRSASLEESTELARVSASAAAGTLSERINRVAGLVRSYSSNFEKQLSSGKEIRRDDLTATLRTMLSYQVATDNLWCVFDPELFGTLDSLSISKQGSTADGTFVPWIIGGKDIYNASNRIDAYPLSEVIREGHQILTEPYKINIGGKEKQVFSFCAPIRVNGRPVGVIGTDFDIAAFNKIVASLNGSWVCKVVTSKGTIALHQIEERIGWQAEYGNPEIVAQLAAGNMFEGMYYYDGAYVYKVYVPISLGEGTKSWYYAVDVPREELYANANTTAVYLIIYCVIGVFLIALAGWFLIWTLLGKVTGITDIIRKLSLGHIDLKIDKTENLDELGKMKNQLGELVDGLKRTANFAQDIGKGNLRADYSLLSNDDALGNSLLEMRQSLQKADNEQTIRAKEEEQRNWVTAGLAKFAEILRRDNDNMETLSYNVISNMVKYLGINQGGIFILNEVENILEMKACYAFDRRKFTEKTIRPGEGLVGTCLLEGESIYLTEIPNEYISITSGLGDANPRALLISPLRINEQIFGVIELASFHLLESYQLEFVQKVSESIAATISSVTVNIRTNNLLAQTKLQAEEMANQEEELRQNMEEMQATQEESRRREIELQETLNRMEEVQATGAEKEHEMKEFHSAIFELNNVMEFSSDGIITDVNDNFLTLFGEKRSYLIGKHLSMFINEDSYRKAKAAMDRGKMYEDVQSIITSAGDRRTVRQRLIPLTDKNGRLQKILMLGFDETHIEEMRQKSEEIRQNMEEMQATQEEMRRHEAELAAANYETEQLQNMIFVTSQVATISPDGIVLDVNDNIVKVFENATKSTFVGKSMAQFIGKAEFDAVIAHSNRGEIYEMVQGMPTGPNKVTIFRQKFVPIRDKGGKLLRVMMVANDETHIDEMRRREEEMQKMTERMETVGNNLPDGVLYRLVRTADGKMYMEYVSAKWEEITGLKPEAVAKDMSPFFALVHPDDLQDVVDATNSSAKEFKKFHVELRIRKSNGEYRWLQITSKPYAENNRIIWDGIMLHISKTKRLQEKLDNERYELKQFNDMIVDTFNMVEFSPEGIIIDINQNTVGFFENATRRDFIGKTMENIIGKQESNTAMANCKASKVYENLQAIPTGPNKTTMFRQKFIPICSNDGKLLRILMIAYEDLQEKIENDRYELNQYYQAIFKTCNVVVSSPEGIVIDINDRLLSMFGNAPKDAFVGKPMSAFTGEESFKKIWADMHKGKIYENTQQVDTGVGGVITYRQRFVPICDKNGKLLKVFELTDPE